MAVKSVVFVLGIIAISEIAGRSMPSYFKPCKRDDPNINKCLVRLMERFRPYISKGTPEMDEFPLDPIMVPSLSINQTSGGPLNFVAEFTDLKGYGAKNFQIQKIIVNFKKQALEVDLNLPLFRVQSRYEVNGHILKMPMVGAGEFVGHFTNVQTKVIFKLNIVEKKNHTNFIELDAKKSSLILGVVKVHFSHLFKSNKELGEKTNRFINDYWELLTRDMWPLFNSITSTIVLRICKPVFETFSMDDLFPV